MPVYLCGDTAPSLNAQHKQAMQSIAYGKKEGTWSGADRECGGDGVQSSEIIICRIIVRK